MKQNYLETMDYIIAELYKHIEEESVDKYYKATLDHCKELLAKEEQESK